MVPNYLREKYKYRKKVQHWSRLKSEVETEIEG